MKQTLYLTYLLLLFCCNQAISQEKTLTLMSSTGSFQSGYVYSISSSVGEVAIISEFGANYSVAQGFQQPDTTSSVPIPDCPPNCANSIKVYPNPSTDKFNIEFFFPGSSDLYLEVFNMKGSKINQYHLNISSYGERVTLDFSDYPKGLYFFKIFSTDGKAMQKFKVVKM